jgi:hypothetical protein
MQLRLLASFAGIMLAGILAADAQRGSSNVCATAAFQEYNRMNLALLQSAPFKTMEIAIAQRRLQEQFCARFVACLHGDTSKLPAQLEFSRCLEDEAKEQYGLIPRSSD